jgi:hypothetical protein
VIGMQGYNMKGGGVPGEYRMRLNIRNYIVGWGNIRPVLVTRRS